MSKTKTQRGRECQMTLSGCFLLKKITNCLAGCDKWRLWKTHQRKTKIAWSQDYKLRNFSILIPLCLRQQIYRYTYIQKRFIIFAIHIDNLHVCNVIFMRNFSRKTKNFWLWRTEGCVWTHQFLHGPFWTSLIILFLPSKYYTLIFKMGIEI